MTRLSRFASFCAASAALAFVPHAAAASLSLTVGDFNAADWKLRQISDDGPSEATMEIDANLGNPGSHWVISYATPRNTGTSASLNRVAAFYTAAAYDPAKSGPLQSLSFSADIKGLSSSFAFDSLGAIRPALLQDGVAYTFLSSDFTGSKAQIGTYLSAQWSFQATTADWVTAVTGSTQHPDFSASGAPITVGFRYTLATNCTSVNGCAGGSAFLSLDNFAATLTPVAAPVPEPSAWMLLVGGLGVGGGFRALRRRRS